MPFLIWIGFTQKLVYEIEITLKTNHTNTAMNLTDTKIANQLRERILNGHLGSSADAVVYKEFLLAVSIRQDIEANAARIEAALTRVKGKNEAADKSSDQSKKTAKFTLPVDYMAQQVRLREEDRAKVKASKDFHQKWAEVAAAIKLRRETETMWPWAGKFGKSQPLNQFITPLDQASTTSAAVMPEGLQRSVIEVLQAKQKEIKAEQVRLLKQVYLLSANLLLLGKNIDDMHSQNGEDPS